MAIRKTAELTKLMKERSIKEENILYLPIKGVFLDQIVSGEKKIEYRAFSDHYLNKMIDFEAGEDKPIHYILFQVGYSANAKRALVSLDKNAGRKGGMGEWGMWVKDENGSIDYAFGQNPYIEENAIKDGFDLREDEFIYFYLGEVLYTEGY